jgi:hypothetical protein|tara:strand:+ start:294 stop:740 length:447 start_codon:yes stop_codon:yes gene_type:complete
MKKSEFKNLIKPLVHECIRESLVEDGLISSVIAEVVRGMTTAQPLVEHATPPRDPEVAQLQRNAFNKETSKKLHEQKKKLMSSIGKGSYNGIDLFEGTTPAPGQTSPQQQAGSLAGHSPQDPGVDINTLFGAVGSNWNAHMTEIKESK